MSIEAGERCTKLDQFEPAVGLGLLRSNRSASHRNYLRRHAVVCMADGSEI